MEETNTAKTNEAKPVAKTAANSKMGLYALVGIVIVVLVIGIGAAIWMMMSNSTQTGNYSAANPTQLQDQINAEARESLRQLRAVSVDDLQNDPSTIISTLAPNEDFGANYKLNMLVETSGSQPFEVSAQMEGQFAMSNSEVAMDGQFDADLGGGISFGIKGEYVYTDETFFLSVPNAGALIGTELPSKWISFSETDLVSTVDSNDTLSEEEQAELEAELEKLARFDGEILTAGTQAPARTIYGVELPCAQYRMSQEFLEYLENTVDATTQELPDNANSLIEYTICADGEEKPMAIEVSYSMDDSQTKATFTLEYEKLTNLPTIVAPDATEVTSFNELVGRSIEGDPAAEL